jgi:hypothetical protein
MKVGYRYGVCEIDRLLEGGNKDRFEYFMHKVVDWDGVWSLKSKDGWVLLGERNGR